MQNLFLLKKNDENGSANYLKVDLSISLSNKMAKDSSIRRHSLVDEKSNRKLVRKLHRSRTIACLHQKCMKRSCDNDCYRCIVVTGKSTGK